MSARRTALLLSLMWGASTCLAGEAEPAEAEPAEAEPTVQPASEAARPEAQTPDVFIPTEEISEDFAVPFPVDI